MTVLRVRRDAGADADAVRAVHRAAFARGDGPPTGAEPAEVALVDALRADAGWLPHLSLVAVVDGEISGHVTATRALVGRVPALGVGPLGVRPSAQGRGVGTALVYALLGAAQARGETLVALLGAPEYYGRFGFVAAEDLGVRPPDRAWGRHFQALALADPAPTGTFRYAAPFDDLDRTDPR